MATKTEKSEFSAGARYERKAIREYLERCIAKRSSRTRQQALTEVAKAMDARSAKMVAFKQALTWVRGRQNRYDQKQGGL